MEERKFHIYLVERIEEGIQILTDVPAGEPDQAGKYPEDSVNGKVHARLADLAEKRVKYSMPIASRRKGDIP